MDQTPLDGIAAKLGRAEVHMNALYDEITAFFDSEPHEFPVERNPQTGEHVVRVRVLREPDFTRWGVLVGDVVHNCRSALDHLVWQLVILSDAEPTTQNQFPIALSEPDYWEPSKPNRLSMRDWRLKGVAEKYRAPIDAIQPYQAGDPVEHAPLAVLRNLSNVDKHQVVHTGFVAAEVPEPLIDYEVTGDGGSIVSFEATTGPLEDGAVILRIRIDPPSSNVHVKSSGPIGVSLGDPPIEDGELERLVGLCMQFVASYGGHFGLTPVVQGSPPTPRWVRRASTENDQV